jgi:hypothetical protein
MIRLWIADPEASQRRTFAWALRDRFDLIDEFESVEQLQRAILVAGPFEALFESRSGEWLLLALVRGDAQHLLVIACRAEMIASSVRRSVRR